MPPASRRSRSRSRYQRPLQELIFSPWLVVPAALILGSFLASQVISVNPRYLKLLFGAVFFLAAVRLPMHYVMAVFAVVFTMPTFIFVGDTNTIFIGLLTAIWLGKMALRLVPRPVRTPLDWAIPIYLGLHVLSLINVSSSEMLQRGGAALTFLTSGTLLYVLLVNNIRTEFQLGVILRALCVTSLFVDVTGLVEYWFGYKLIPEWFLYSAGQSYVETRVGAVFGSHALLADWCAMMFFLQVMLGMRASKLLGKFYYYGLATLSLVMIALTVNRGGAMAWGVGALYFSLLMRERIPWVRTMVLAPAVLGLFLALQALGAGALGRIRLFARIAGTQLERGVPDTRVDAWADVFRRIPEHLWIGHGPAYSNEGSRMAGFVWPHSAYFFYLYTTGILGLLAWLWMLFKLFWISFPGWKLDFQRVSLATATRGLVHIQLVIFAFAQLRSDHQRGNVYLYVMWILFALAVIATQLHHEQRAAKHQARATGPEGGSLRLPTDLLHLGPQGGAGDDGR